MTRDACHRIFDEFPIGVVPIRYRELFYCPRCAEMVTDKTCGHPVAGRVGTSQTRVRCAIAEGQTLPMDILRPEITKLLGRPGALLDGPTGLQRRPILVPGGPTGRVSATVPETVE